MKFVLLLVFNVIMCSGHLPRKNPSMKSELNPSDWIHLGTPKPPNTASIVLSECTLDLHDMETRLTNQIQKHLESFINSMTSEGLTISIAHVSIPLYCEPFRPLLTYSFCFTSSQMRFFWNWLPPFKRNWTRMNQVSQLSLLCLSVQFSEARGKQTTQATA